MANYKKIITLALGTALVTGTLTGCFQKKTAPIGIDTENPTIVVMTSATKTTPADQDSPVVQEIQRYIGEKMSEKYGKEYDKVTFNFNWVSSSAYDEKVITVLGAGKLPHMMLINTRNSSVVQNSRVGNFWDITDAFTKTDPKYVSESNPEGYVYPNLAKADPAVNRNISVDGKIYGIYRSRELGRQGVTIRKDWLDNLGLDMPETMADFEEVLRAFTEDDPDGNGKDDTYGMIITTFLDGPVRNLATWMGSPNQWGYDEASGSWKPWFMSQGYFDALTKLREWYAAGYINKNMATLDPNSWDEDFLNGVGGMQIDIATRATKNARNIKAQNPNAEVDVFGYVTKDENTEPRTWPTTGHGGYYVFPKSTIKTEEELDFILSVLDECNSEYVLDLCIYGIEGRNYTLDKDGRAVKSTDPAMILETTDLPQFSTGVAPINLQASFTSDVDKKLDSVHAENRKYAVANPMEPYTSDSYAISGSQLDAIIGEAEVNYIIGTIDEKGYKEAIDQWLNMDGNLVCSDYQDAYEKDESNRDGNGNLVIPDEYKADFKF